MAALSSILRKIFSEGIESVPKRGLEEIFQTSRKGLEEAGTQKLFRRDLNAPELMEKGFDPSSLGRGPLISELDEAALMRMKGGPEGAYRAVREGLTPEDERALALNYSKLYAYDNPSEEFISRYIRDMYDIPGLYWSAGSLKAVPPYQRKGQIIEGLMNPESTVKPEMWRAIEAFNTGKIKYEPLATEPNFLTRESGGGEEHLIQRSPGQVLARLGDKYRILGLAGALGAGGGLASAMGEPEEAEAGLFEDAMKRTIKRMAKRATKTAVEEAGTVTSSAKVLTGKELEGKIVKTVKSSGNENWRHVVFEDGSEKAYPKDTISSLCRNIGTRAYAQMLEEKDAPSQLSQALNSLTYHEQRQRTFTTKTMLDDYLKIHQSRLKEMGQEPEPMTYIAWPFKGYIPSMYVPILKDAGRIKLPTKKVTE